MIKLAGGNQGVTVTVNSQPSNSVNFFVQVPTSLSIVPGTDSTTSESGCSTNLGTGCGVTRTFTLQVYDQETPPQPIQAAGLEVWDAINTTSPNNLGLTGYSTTCTGTAAGTNNGPCGLTTTSLGQFEESSPGLTVCSTVCYMNNACATGGPTNATQTTHVGPSSINLQISYYCNHVTWNGQ